MTHARFCVLVALTIGMLAGGVFPLVAKADEAGGGSVVSPASPSPSDNDGRGGDTGPPVVLRQRPLNEGRSRWSASLQAVYIFNIWNRPYRELSKDWFNDEGSTSALGWRPRVSYLLNPRGSYQWSLQAGLIYANMSRSRHYETGSVRLSYYRVAAETAVRLMFPNQNGYRFFTQADLMLPSHERTRLQAGGVERGYKEMNTAFGMGAGIWYPIAGHWATEASLSVNTLSEFSLGVGGNYVF